MTGIPDETFASRTRTPGLNCPPEVEVAVRAIEKRLKWPSMHWGVEDVSPDAWPHVAAAVLDAVGLPALLERVEAAEGERGRLIAAHQKAVSMGRQMDAQYLEAIAERDALAAKVSDAWDEVHAEMCEYDGATCPHSNPNRAALTEGTEG